MVNPFYDPFEIFYRVLNMLLNCPTSGSRQLYPLLKNVLFVLAELFRILPGTARYLSTQRLFYYLHKILFPRFTWNWVF